MTAPYQGLLDEMTNRLFEWNSDHSGCENQCPHREDPAYRKQAESLFDLVFEVVCNEVPVEHAENQQETDRGVSR